MMYVLNFSCAVRPFLDSLPDPFFSLLLNRGQ